MDTSVCCLNPTQAVALQSWLFNIFWIQTILWNSYSSKCLCEHPFCLSPSPFFVVDWSHLEVRLLSQRSFILCRPKQSVWYSEGLSSIKVVLVWIMSSLKINLKSVCTAAVLLVLWRFQCFLQLKEGRVS